MRSSRQLFFPPAQHSQLLLYQDVLPYSLNRQRGGWRTHYWKWYVSLSLFRWQKSVRKPPLTLEGWIVQARPVAGSGENEPVVMPATYMYTFHI